MNKNNCWLFLYNHHKEDEWSLPKGFSKTLSETGLEVIDLIFESDDEINLPDEEFVRKKNIKVLLIFYAGYNERLNSEILKFKLRSPEVIIINELGDEPQTQHLNYIRASLSDICLSPDYESKNYWVERGFNCKWFTHWADSKIFYKNKNFKERKQFLTTTMGRRKYDIFLKIILGSLYKNQKIVSYENTSFYNNSQNVFQYSRWDEITRRIFEASACGCCVITNRIHPNKQLEKIFSHNESIIFFKGRISLFFEIFKLFINKNKSKRIGETASYIVHNNHTDKVRAFELLKYVNEYEKKI